MSEMILIRSRVVDARPEVVWDVVADIGGYAAYVDTLEATEVVAGNGRGAQRRCTDTRGRSWQETCAFWEPGHTYTMSVHTDTYPLGLRMLFRTFTGTWSVTPHAGGMTLVTLRFAADVRGGPLGAAAVALMRRKAYEQIDDIIDAYEREAVSRVTA